MPGQWHPAIQRLIRALDAERAAGRNRQDPVSRDRIEKAGEETDGALSDAALADVAAGEAGDRVWIDGLRPVLAFWRRTGHLELPKTVDGKPWGPERWLRAARADPATPDWVSAALNLLVDMRAREIPASLAEAVAALAELRRLQAAEPEAPAELVRAQAAVERALTRADEALAPQAGDSRGYRDHLPGLQALLTLLRSNLGIETVKRGTKVDGLDVYSWLNNRFNDRGADPAWLQQSIGALGIQRRGRATLSDGRAAEIRASVAAEAAARQDLRRIQGSGQALAGELEQAPDERTDRALTVGMTIPGHR